MDKQTKHQIIGVLGAGTMGSGIAQVVATANYPVILHDSDNYALKQAEQNLAKILNRQVEKGRISLDECNNILSQIEFTADVNRFSPCDMVIEAIIEDLSIKQEVFTQIEPIVSDTCILATNTSSLAITAIGSICKIPERFIGTHFFNPAPLMSLVEIIPALFTSTQTLQITKQLIEEFGKIGVQAKDTPGFIVNRVARPFYGEALRILEEGIADVATIDWAMKEIGGFKMGPFELMDLIGNDINFKVTQTVFEAFFYDPRFKPSLTQQRLVEAKRLGRKSSMGYYNYDNKASNPDPQKNEVLGQSIFFRILAMLINEAADAKFLNIATASDIDLAVTKGLNYPQGLLKWADEIGLDKVLQKLIQLQEEYGEDRYRPNPLLKRMVSDSQLFFA